MSAQCSRALPGWLHKHTLLPDCQALDSGLEITFGLLVRKRAGSSSSWISCCCCCCLRWGKGMNRVVPRCLPASPVPAKPELREHQETRTQPLLPQMPQSGFPRVGESAGSACPRCKKSMGKPNRLLPFASSFFQSGSSI
ncbi:uncharacterized protein LJ206_015425 [Theristicus caerulescens]